MGVSFTYNLAGSGTAFCEIQINEQRASIVASYLADGLDDLLRAMVNLLNGADETSALFADEPGEYRWRFTPIGTEHLRVQILHSSKLWKNRPDSECHVELDATCRLRTFVGAVLSAAQRVLAEHGLEGYRQKWVNYDFPLQRLEELKGLLAATRNNRQRADAEPNAADVTMDVKRRLRDDAR